MISSEAKTFFENLHKFRDANSGPFDLKTLRINANRAGQSTVEPKGIITKEIEVGGTRALHLIPANAASNRQLVFIHGGAFGLMSPESHHRFAGHVAIACKAETLIPEYGLAPEHPFPYALHQTTEFIKASMQNIPSVACKTILLGESAGAALALAGTQELRDKNMATPSCLVLTCPWLDLSLSGDSIKTNEQRDVILLRRNFDIFISNYLQTTGYAATDPKVSPLFASMSDLPPVYCQAAGLDMLLDDATRLADQIRNSGGQIQIDVFTEMFHSFQFYAGRFPETVQAINQIGSFVDKQLR